MVGSCCAIVGVLIISLPIPIIVNTFNKLYEKAKIKNQILKKKKLAGWIRGSSGISTPDGKILSRTDIRSVLLLSKEAVANRVALHLRQFAERGRDVGTGARLDSPQHAAHSSRKRGAAALSSDIPYRYNGVRCLAASHKGRLGCQEGRAGA